LFRREQQGPDYEDFDPLEMDSYSQPQQLSRSLVESASDLMDIKSTLLNKTKDAKHYCYSNLVLILNCKKG